MNKEIMITQQDLIDWLDRPPSNDDIDLINFIVCRLDNFYKLKEENERLKEENKRIFSKVNDDELLISNAMNYAEAQEYKSRCEKAIEYIKKLQLNDDIEIWRENGYWVYILHLLGGDDNGNNR